MGAMDILDQEFQKARAEKVAKRKADRDASEEKRQMGRRNKRRGYRVEHHFEQLLKDLGFSRVPLSGRLRGRLSGDLRRDRWLCQSCGHEDWYLLGEELKCHKCGEKRLAQVYIPIATLECKERQGAFKTLSRWLEVSGSDFLLIEPMDDEPMAVCSFKKFMEFLKFYEGGEK